MDGTPATWVKSSYSDRECVAVARKAEVSVADTKTGYRDVFTVAPATWSAFLTEVKSGQRETAN